MTAMIEPPTLSVLEVCKIIAAHLKTRSGKAWSVTKGSGTAYCWITISAPPRRRDECGVMVESDRRELADLLGLDSVHQQGEVVPGSSAYHAEYMQRAAGLVPSVRGKPYWD